MSEGNVEDFTGDGFERRDVVVHRTGQDDAGSLSVSVVEALATAKGVSPVEVERPLYDAVDPDALDRLFTDETGDANSRLTFEHTGYEVTVHAHGEILVRELSDE